MNKLTENNGSDKDSDSCNDNNAIENDLLVFDLLPEANPIVPKTIHVEEPLKVAYHYKFEEVGLPNISNINNNKMNPIKKGD